MKTIIINLFLLSLLITAKAQSEILRINDDLIPIELKSLDIAIKVVGNSATTVAKMTFYNPNDEVLEGELNFPLAEGQKVFRFAMDVNGKLREGVVVEKELGRQAFEGIVRQAIDPGLLEQTVGNNYKTRIYPIPANGRKTVLVGYEEELKSGKASFYQLITRYGLVKDFQLKLEVINQKLEPIIKKEGLVDLKFEKRGNSYITESKKRNFNATGTFSLEIPSNIKEQVFRQDASGSDFFYISALPKVIRAKKKLPSSLAIIWDTSKSSLGRDTSEEFKLIRNYLELISNVNVHVISFSNAIIDKQECQVVDGNSDELIALLGNMVYDGGTNFKSLELENLNYEEILLFTDGISNLDEFTKTDGVETLHIVTSNKSNNNDFCKFLSKNTGGNFINLLNTTLDDALDVLTNVQYQFLGATYNASQIEEVYPNRPISIKENSMFSIAGKIKTDKSATIRLNFGLQGQILESRKITIPKKVNDNGIDRLWAGKKLTDLLENVNHNPQDVMSLGKTYSIVTPYTSLIVLDRVEDYVRYNIEPPVELKEEYDLLITEKKEKTKSSKNEIIEIVLAEYEDRIKWWQEDQEETSLDVASQNNISGNPNDDSNMQNETSASQLEQRSNSESISAQPSDTLIFNRVVEGQVFSDDGLALIGAAVLIKGTAIGTVTDVEGFYKIRVRENDVLVISYTGYSTQEIAIGNNSKININLESGVTLSEVVVVKASAVAPIIQSSYSTSAIEIGDQIQGRTLGLDIQYMKSSTLISQGRSSIYLGANPLYLIDGEIVEIEEVNWLGSEKIASVNIINGKKATTIYGDSAIDGVIIIITKNALENNLSLPDSIISAFETDFLIKEWIPDEPYLDSIMNTPSEKQYEMYLRLRKDYGQSPSFYLGVGNYFIQSNREKLGLRILSNIVELELENHELLKILAHRYLQLGLLETSIYLFKKILDLRPDEPQSKRDLALAYEGNGEYQKAIDLFNEIILEENIDMEDRFPLIKSTVLYEMNNIIAMHKNQLELSQIPKELIIEMPVDIRVVLDWNSLETDLDLWIIEPNGEECYYSNKLTKIGGRLTEDYIDGYGPEEYILKNALPGEYKIEVEFYDDRVQKISGPATLQISIFTNYGSEKQQVIKLTRELKDSKDVIEIGKFDWKGKN